MQDVEPDLLGRAYEYLLRKFAEGGGQSAGEFFTPREVGLLMATILDPAEGDRIFDPACGSGGLLIKAQLRLREKVAAEKGVDSHDLKTGDIARPLQLFGQEINADTSAPGIILVLNRAKAHPGEILLINASKLFYKGKPKNHLSGDHIRQIFDLYQRWQVADNLSAIVTTEEVIRNDYNLSPSRYVATDEQEPALPLEEALVLLAEAEEARREADEALDSVLTTLGFAGWREG